jgi:hypothetical protein
MEERRNIPVIALSNWIRILAPSSDGGKTIPGRVNPFHNPDPRTDFEGAQDYLFFFLALAHRAFAAFLARFSLSSAVRAAMRFFPPLPPAALPPFLPISRMTSEIRSRRIAPSYEERSAAASPGPLTQVSRSAKLYATCATGIKPVRCD